MVDEELLKRLKVLGVKTASFFEGGDLYAVEFFPEPALSFEATDDEPAVGEGEPIVPVPPALARMLKRGSVS